MMRLAGYVLCMFSFNMYNDLFKKDFTHDYMKAHHTILQFSTGAKHE